MRRKSLRATMLTAALLVLISMAGAPAALAGVLWAGLVDPTKVSNLNLYFEKAMANNPKGIVDVARVFVSISDMTQKAPEPATIIFAGSVLLAGSAMLRRRRSAAPSS